MCDQKRALKNVATVLDSTLIRLTSRGHEWADKTASGLNNKELKLHVQYNHSEEHIEYTRIENANLNNVTVAQSLPLDANRIYIFDKGLFLKIRRSFFQTEIPVQKK